MVSRNNRILGLILAGGQGSRMGGVDKGMIEHKGQPLIELVLERLKPQCDEVVISANRNLAEYRKLKLKVLPDESSDTYDGPLAGICSTITHAQTTQYDLLLISSCDTPELPYELGQRLLLAMLEQDRSSAVAHDGSHQQNLHCLIARSEWPSLIDFFRKGGRALYQWHKQQGSIQVDFSDYARGFKNINHFNDLSDF